MLRSVIKGILDVWVVGKGFGPGMPDKFHFDYKGEFNNDAMLDLGKKYGITLNGTTAANFPYSN